MIGIAGGTGSGKTTISASVVADLDGIGVVQHDAYYRHQPELTYEERSRVNYDHPESLETELLVEHLRGLRAGIGFDRPNYDFTTHLRSPDTERIEPCPAVIVEGILVLYEPEIRDLLDLKIFIDTDSDLRLARRLQRDIDERGRTIDAVLRQYFETVRPMFLEYVEPSKRHADVVIQGGYNPGAVAMVIELIRSRLGTPSPQPSQQSQIQ
ncbi:MAG: uridine kinase [Acidimicrobiia bacterium]|nr:uridine kinase [Acidimicrobiia bacterium]